MPSQFPNFHVAPQIKIGEKREETFSSALHPPPHPPAKKTTSKMRDNRSYSHTSQTRAKEATGQLYFFCLLPSRVANKTESAPSFSRMEKDSDFCCPSLGTNMLPAVACHFFQNVRRQQQKGSRDASRTHWGRYGRGRDGCDDIGCGEVLLGLRPPYT